MHDTIKVTVDEAVDRLSRQAFDADSLRDEQDQDSITWGLYIYQMRAWQFALPQSQSIAYLLPALQGEVGELSEIFAKVERDNNGLIGDDEMTRIRSELGDVLWMVAGIASHFALDLGEIGWENVQKLTDRQRRGKINGSGDDR